MSSEQMTHPLQHRVKRAGRNFFERLGQSVEPLRDYERVLRGRPAPTLAGIGDMVGNAVQRAWNRRNGVRDAETHITIRPTELFDPNDKRRAE